MPADILILGEHDKGHGEPFSRKTVSGRRLRQLVADLSLDVDLGNVFEYVNSECRERDLRAACRGYAIVVTVGRVASAECTRQGVEHTYLPHPAVRSAKQLAALRSGLEAVRSTNCRRSASAQNTTTRGNRDGNE